MKDLKLFGVPTGPTQWPRWHLTLFDRVREFGLYMVADCGRMANAFRRDFIISAAFAEGHPPCASPLTLRPWNMASGRP